MRKTRFSNIIRDDFGSRRLPDRLEHGFHMTNISNLALRPGLQIRPNNCKLLTILSI